MSKVLKLVLRSSEARQLLGTSYAGSMSVTAGALSESAPLPSRHWDGMLPGLLENNDQSGVGIALPTHDRTEVAPGSPVAADASARIPGRSISRNSPIPPR